MKCIYCFLVALLFVGCATANIERLSQQQGAHVVLCDSEKVFIALPEDGSFDGASLC